MRRPLGYGERKDLVRQISNPMVESLPWWWPLWLMIISGPITSRLYIRYIFSKYRRDRLQSKLKSTK